MHMCIKKVSEAEAWCKGDCSWMNNGCHPKGYQPPSPPPLITKEACGVEQFRCKNGQCKNEYSGQSDLCFGSCLPLVWKCDGVEGCTDGSDESVETCGGKLIYVLILPNKLGERLILLLQIKL